MKNSIQLSMIDFTKPWWRIILKRPWLLCSVILLVTVRDLFRTFEPFLIALILEHHNWYIFAGASGIWLFYQLNLITMSFINPQFQLSIIHSLYYSAHQHLLLIDPVYHVKRSSGAVLAKIDRAARGYEDILDQVTFDFAPLCIGITSMLIVFSRYSVGLTCVVAGALTSMLGYAYYFVRNGGQKIERRFIVSDDEFKSTAFENLAQIQLIRTTFATDYMRDKLTNTIVHNSDTEKRVWRSYSFVSRTLNVIYILSTLLLIAFFMHELRSGNIQLAHAIGIILAYISSTHALIKIVQPMRRFLRGYTAVTDLFEAMQHFGNQTIPVFDGQSTIIHKGNELNVEAHDLVFGYRDAKVFNYHSLLMHMRKEQQNKLYGIIGPSGVGKTTLLSILGGQLKPLVGTVCINGVDIYAVNDRIRRQLIALQGQVATSVKGSVRYNLLFGLPHNHGYSDDYLLEVLDRVGLKQVLAEHKGLDTMLGEGALNISGGQRQRLNFVGLYLRARFYRPILILIDEPTSSLDDISEIAVTNMIVELSHSAITCVIAHRLRTIEQARGLIDLSLLALHKDITIYSPEELKVQSVYYRTLLQQNEQ